MSGTKKPSGGSIRILRPEMRREDELDGPPTDVVGTIPDFTPTHPPASHKAKYELWRTREVHASPTPFIDFFQDLDCAYVICEGTVIEESYASHRAVEMPIRALGPGNLIGTEAFKTLCQGAESQSRYVATTNVVLYVIDLEQLETSNLHLRIARARYLVEAIGIDAWGLKALKDGIIPGLLDDRVSNNEAQVTIEGLQQTENRLKARIAEFEEMLDRAKRIRKDYLANTSLLDLTGFPERETKLAEEIHRLQEENARLRKDLERATRRESERVAELKSANAFNEFLVSYVNELEQGTPQGAIQLFRDVPGMLFIRMIPAVCVALLQAGESELQQLGFQYLNAFYDLQARVAKKE